MLVDGEIPIDHLHYGNRRGDGSTPLTSFRYRQAAGMGRRGTDQLHASTWRCRRARSASGSTA